MAEVAKKSSKKLTIILMLILIMLMIMPSLALVILGGSLPTVMAVLGDKGGRKSLTVCVGMMNLAGLLPVLFYSYEYYPIWGSVSPEIYQLTNWLIIYLAAFIGLCLYWLIPGVVVKVYSFYLRQKIKAIEKQKMKLESVYGKDVLLDSGE